MRAVEHTKVNIWRDPEAVAVAVAVGDTVTVHAPHLPPASRRWTGRRG